MQLKEFFSDVYLGEGVNDTLAKRKLEKAGKQDAYDQLSKLDQTPTKKHLAFRKLKDFSILNLDIIGKENTTHKQDTYERHIENFFHMIGYLLSIKTNPKLLIPYVEKTLNEMASIPDKDLQQKPTSLKSFSRFDSQLIKAIIPERYGNEKKSYSREIIQFMAFDMPLNKIPPTFYAPLITILKNAYSDKNENYHKIFSIINSQTNQTIIDSCATALASDTYHGLSKDLAFYVKWFNNELTTTASKVSNEWLIELLNKSQDNYDKSNWMQAFPNAPSLSNPNEIDKSLVNPFLAEFAKRGIDTKTIRNGYLIDAEIQRLKTLTPHPPQKDPLDKVFAEPEPEQKPQVKPEPPKPEPVTPEKPEPITKDIKPEDEPLKPDDELKEFVGNFLKDFKF